MSREFQLGCIFPQLRSWWERKLFYETGDEDPRHSLEALTAYYRKHRIGELLETLDKVEAGEAPASALEEFHPRPRPQPRNDNWRGLMDSPASEAAAEPPAREPEPQPPEIPATRENIRLAMSQIDEQYRRTTKR